MNDFMKNTDLTERACFLSAASPDGSVVMSSKKDYYEVVNFNGEAMFKVLREEQPDVLINYLTEEELVYILKKDRHGGAYREVSYLPKERKFRGKYPFTGGTGENYPESFHLSIPRDGLEEALTGNLDEKEFFAEPFSPVDGSTMRHQGLAYFFAENLRDEAVDSNCVHELFETFQDPFLEEALIDFGFKRRLGESTNQLNNLKNFRELIKDRKPRKSYKRDIEHFQFEGKIPGIKIFNQLEIFIAKKLGAGILLDNGDVLGFKACGISIALCVLGFLVFPLTFMLIVALAGITPFILVVLYHRGTFDFIFDKSEKDEDTRKSSFEKESEEE